MKRSPQPVDAMAHIEAMIDDMIEQACQQAGKPEDLREDISLLCAVFVSARDFLTESAQSARKELFGKKRKKELSKDQLKLIEVIEKKREGLHNMVAHSIIGRLEALVSRQRTDWISRN
jgi:hypothetical protein